MIRAISRELERWKEMKDRKPLLVRGARQVGKSWSIEQFGHDHFDDLIVLNFDLYPKYSACFVSPDPKKIIPSIELLTGQKVSPGTLIFLDEIQECPDAIRSASSCARRERSCRRIA